MRAPSEFKVRESSGKWYVDEHRGGMVSRDFRRFKTEAEAQEEADRLTRAEASIDRYLAKRAAEGRI